MIDENVVLAGHNPLTPILMLEVFIQQGAPDSVDARIDLSSSTQNEAANCKETIPVRDYNRLGSITTETKNELNVDHVTRVRRDISHSQGGIPCSTSGLRQAGHP